MTLRTDLKEVNRLSKDATGYQEHDPFDANFYIAALKLFKEHGDSLEDIADYFFTMKVEK